MAIHPLGYHIVAGFVDKLRFMNVLVDDLQTVFEFDVRSCREVSILLKFPNSTDPI